MPTCAIQAITLGCPAGCSEHHGPDLNSEVISAYTCQMADIIGMVGVC